MQEKIEAYRRFWRGEGPSLILIPPATMPVYDLEDYPRLFHDPEAMWESEIRRARAVADWPTDGIPTVRPNLGVVFVPSMGGLSYELKPNQMPWPGEPIGREAIRAARDKDVAQSELMQLAARFYEIHRESGENRIAAYHADTQGVFDIAHLLYGDEVFYELPDEKEAAWIDELLQISHGLYVKATEHLKRLLGEEAGCMIHGHGTPQGAFFPNAGARMAEDTPTLLSPQMIEDVILPLIRRAAEPFGGAFVHYCGHHEAFFDLLCRMECVRAIDLGNPEMYEPRRLLEHCGETGTVLYSCIRTEQDEAWEHYTRRIAGIVREAGARAILRPAVFPEDRAEAEQMLALWHELTG